MFLMTNTNWPSLTRFLALALSLSLFSLFDPIDMVMHSEMLRDVISFS